MTIYLIRLYDIELDCDCITRAYKSYKEAEQFLIDRGTTEKVQEHWGEKHTNYIIQDEDEKILKIYEISEIELY